MTWGRYIYCAKDKVTDDILVHELLHVKQHRGSWWIALKKFLFTKDWEQDEEEAHNYQLRFLLEDEDYRNNGRRTKGEIYRKVTERV